MEDNSKSEIIDYYKNASNSFILNEFLLQVRNFFETDPILNEAPFPIIHSVKSRIKDPEHLYDKLERKKKKGVIVTTDNLYSEVTDLIGVRVLHLYQDQFKNIHDEILKKVYVLGDWKFVREPKAYTWDPESEQFYSSLRIKTEISDSFYTSVHYIVKPNNDNNPVCCEIQVRTLFEEIWGEIDHTINYPHETDSIACKEQLRVLSKLVSTGTRLSDSIFRSYTEFMNSK